MVEERYAQLYLFPRSKAVLIEVSDKNKLEAGYPIPKHLKDILIPTGKNNDENRVDEVYGHKKGKDIYIGEYKNDSVLMIKEWLEILNPQ
ncbi:hypothetical protein [Paenibacillus tyrfis]|uniref:Uncharacterized protein n=1 Tax=Paenibacillus tyrfis TaxID=1501230 RepID=A0A081NUY7_9BACL|nr:hypothetical protein [Paenibacillus tyrfis]KEQ22260.1 hypothetical protein ET33_27175 [Paenibacillus tyrfis]